MWVADRTCFRIAPRIVAPSGAGDVAVSVRERRGWGPGSIRGRVRTTRTGQVQGVLLEGLESCLRVVDVSERESCRESLSAPVSATSTACNAAARPVASRPTHRPTLVTRCRGLSPAREEQHAVSHLLSTEARQPPANNLRTAARRGARAASAFRPSLHAPTCRPTRGDSMRWRHLAALGHDTHELLATLLFATCRLDV